MSKSGPYICTDCSHVFQRKSAFENHCENCQQSGGKKKAKAKSSSSSSSKALSKQQCKNLKDSITVIDYDKKEEPHIIQIGDKTFRRPFCRFLTKEFPRLKYYSRRGELKTTVHWGQRKLYLSELEFIIDHYKLFDDDSQKIIVYAGAAPGSHIPHLADLFPDIQFNLYDPNPFRHYKRSNIADYNEYFTDEVAKQYEDVDNVMFISDIRTADPTKLSPEEVEEYVQRDQQMQWDWYKIINPIKAMFKFRCPYTPGKYKYMSGKIYLQVWSPLSSSETRLVPDKKKVKTYDNETYEDQMFYFNTQVRPSYYDHTYIERYDHCYDCRAEIHILRRTMAFLGIKQSKEELYKMTDKITEVIFQRDDTGIIPRTFVSKKMKIAQRLYKENNLLRKGSPKS